MLYEGVLRKMKTELGSPIQYFLFLGDDFLNLNQALESKGQNSSSSNINVLIVEKINPSTDKGSVVSVFLKLQRRGIGSCAQNSAPHI